MKSFPWWRGALGVVLVLGTIASGLGASTVAQVQQQATPVQEAFASVWDHVVIVYGYDPTYTASPWASYDTTAPPFANRLQTVEPLAGYFLFLNGDDTWEVGNQRRQLYRGWNLVGWPGMAGPGLPPMPPAPSGMRSAAQQQGTPVQEAFASAWSRVVIVYGYDPTNTASPWASYDTTAPPFANRLQTVEPLAGYFLFLNGDNTWVVGNQRRQLYRGWNLVGWPGMAGPGLPPMPPTPSMVSPTPVVGDEGGPISAGVTVSGRINPSGDTDDWTFSGQAGQVVTIAMNVATGTSSWDPVVELRDPSGNIETQDDDSGGNYNALIRNWTLRQSGVYAIRARGFGSYTGAYTLLLTMGGAVAPTPTPTVVRPTLTPTPMVVGDEGGPISAGVTVSGRINPSGDTDDWTFSGQAGQVVTIAMNVNWATGTSSWDLAVELRDPSGNIETQDGGGFNALIQNWALRQSGVYAIRARGVGSYTGDYTLLLTAGGAVPTPTPTAARPTPTPTPIAARPTPTTAPTAAGGFTVSDAISAAGERDRYTFVGRVGQWVTISANQVTGAPRWDPQLQLISPDGREETSNSDSGGNLNALIQNWALRQGGTYTIVVYGYGSSVGAYTLILEVRGVGGDGEGGAIASGSSVSGEISPPQDTDRFTFSAVTGQWVTIRLNQAPGTPTADWSWDPQLQLISPDGREETSNSDSGGNLNALIQNWALRQGGTYTIVVYGYGSSVGAYTLILETIRGSGDIEGGAIQSGQSISGTVSPPGDTDRFTFASTQGQMVTIRLNQAPGTPTADWSWDPQLQLISPDGREETSNSDSGGNLNALIQNWALRQSGTYTIVVYGYGSSVGAYTLTLTIG